MSYQVTEGKLSPDGQRLAYVSNENGDPEVYAARLMPDGRAGPGRLRLARIRPGPELARRLDRALDDAQAS